MPACDRNAFEVDRSRHRRRHLQPLQVVVHVALRAGHARVDGGGAFEAAGRPQLGQTRAAVLLQQRHWRAEFTHRRTETQIFTNRNVTFINLRRTNVQVPKTKQRRGDKN